MKFTIQLCLVAAALAGLIVLMLPPAAPVLLGNPLAALGIGLIGWGLIRRAKQATAAEAVAADG